MMSRRVGGVTGVYDEGSVPDNAFPVIGAVAGQNQYEIDLL